MGVSVTVIRESCVGRTAKSLAVYQRLAAEQLRFDVESIWYSCQATPSIVAHHLSPGATPLSFLFNGTASQRLCLF